MNEMFLFAMLASRSKKAKNELSSSERNKAMMESLLTANFGGGKANPVATMLATQQAVNKKIAEKRVSQMAIQTAQSLTQVQETVEEVAEGDVKERLKSNIQLISRQIAYRGRPFPRINLPG